MYSRHSQKYIWFSCSWIEELVPHVNETGKQSSNSWHTGYTSYHHELLKGNENYSKCSRKTVTCLQSFAWSQSSDSSPCHLVAHPESPTESQSPHHLLKHTTWALDWWELWLAVCTFMCLSLPSPSSIRQEQSAFLFRLNDSAKLRSDEPPQMDGRASLSIFPPHVTLRLGILKTGHKSLWLW